MTDSIVLTVRDKITVDWFQDKMLKDEHVWIAFTGLTAHYYKITDFCVTSPPEGRKCPECSTVLHEVEATVELERERP